MYIKSLTASGFRCFGSDKTTTIEFAEDLTVLVGTNGSGKTAVMYALLRLFGITSEQRSICRNDFYLAPDEKREDDSDKWLYLEAVLAFPELTKPQGEESGAIPEFFNQMCIATQGALPQCRIRLEATWSADGTSEGGIEEKLYWLTTTDDVPFGDDENPNKRPMKPPERGRIQVLYIPATRDGPALTRQAIGYLHNRLLKAIVWSEETKQQIKELNEKSQAVFAGETAIEGFTETLTHLWETLHTSQLETTPQLSLQSRELEESLKKITLTLRPTESGGERKLDHLSDGQKSLFYMALISAVFETEQAIRKALQAGNETGFFVEKMRIPTLTIVAMEEPENHLAPFYLSRIIKMIKTQVESPHAMGILSSHSPSVLGRIEPEKVRHFRLDPTTRTALVHQITLPPKIDEAFKFVREAVIAYPELYFARCVILGEGDSEQIILPKLAEALKFNLDPSFVAVVPLGGRHVNHFWRLLEQLAIPYVTLLDLDLGRSGGGWERLLYVLEQLCAVNKIGSADVCETNKNTIIEQINLITDQQLLSMQYMIAWVDLFENDDNVYFSGPLDLDMMMLLRFQSAYKHLTGSDRGPTITDESIQESMKTALGKDGEALFYSGEYENHKPLFPWYRYRFLNKSKPVSHLQALARLTPEELAKNCPPRIKRLLERVNQIVEDAP